jgi:hypothetical protein
MSLVAGNEQHHKIRRLKRSRKTFLRVQRRAEDPYATVGTTWFLGFSLCFVRNFHYLPTIMKSVISAPVKHHEKSHVGISKASKNQSFRPKWRNLSASFSRKR